MNHPSFLLAVKCVEKRERTDKDGGEEEIHPQISQGHLVLMTPKEANLENKLSLHLWNILTPHYMW